MELYIAFIVFIISMLIAIITSHSMVIALVIGLVAFLIVGKIRGYSLESMTKMSIDANQSSLVVIKVMLIIGVLTAAWRVSGTITIFVYYGMKVIMPPIFLLITFLLCCLLSYAIGTSFGVAGTVGVIFMALARSGGVNPLLTAGVVMSGVYFGDRCSPVSSSANMVAGVTETKIYDNVKIMMKTGALPFAITLMVYAILSIANPIVSVDQSMIQTFENEFNLSIWSFLPAIIVIGLPLLKIGVVKAMTASIASAIIVAWLVQGVDLLKVLEICIFGYESSSSGLGAILNGGGLVSMLEIVIILVISSSYSGIFSGTKMLDSLQEKLAKACNKVGRFAIMVAMSIAMSCIFCNQTIGTLMCADLMRKPYIDGGGDNTELAIDLENSVILIACFIPWSIGCSVPLLMLGVDFKALPFAVFMYLVPLCYLFTKKKWFNN
ncbi:MAG: sodium:proton antiporter [Firmicutes bacterium]|nr:sodium:proton antiporter [Bacillota bacterium]